MNILTIDCSREFCATELYYQEHAYHKIENIQRGHAEKLIPQIEQLCMEANFTLDKLNFIVTNTGPGSFTGTRIAVSAARAFALSLKIPAMGISLFSALAYYCQMQSKKQNIAVIINAFEAHYYAMFYRNQPQNFYDISKGKIYSKEEITKILNQEWAIIGDGSTDFTAKSPICHIIENPEQILTCLRLLATKKILQQESWLYRPVPIYIS